MGIPTTCIGAYLKPDYINIASWSESASDGNARADARRFSYVSEELIEVSAELLDRATSEAIADQVAAGINVPTDGEQCRENYIHYHCRHMRGIDFELLTSKVHRNGAAVADLPTISGKIESTGEHFLDRDYEVAQSLTDKPVKITVPHRYSGTLAPSSREHVIFGPQEKRPAASDYCK